MSSLFRQAMSLESNAANVVLDETAAAELELSIESSSLDVLEAGHALELQEYQQEELSYAHGKLASIADSIALSIESNSAGLTRGEAQLAQLAVESVTGGALENPIVSLESFGGDSERAEASQVSLEGFKARLQSIWNTIKDAVTKAISAIGEFLSKMFDAKAKLAKKVEALRTSVNALEDSNAPSEVVVKSEGGRLHEDGTFSKSEVTKAAAFVKSNYPGYIDSVATTAIEYFNATTEFYKSKKVEVEELNDSEEEAGKKLEASERPLARIKLPGGKVISQTEKTKEDGRVTLTPASIVDGRTPKYTGDGKLQGMSKSELESVLKDVEDALKASEGLKKKREDMNDARKKALDEAQAWVKALEGKTDSAVTQVQLSWALRRTQRGFSRTLSNMDRYALGVMKAVLSVVDAQVKAYGTKKDD